MTNGTDTKPRNRAERDADRKSRQRLEQAGIVEGLRTILDSSEQLLGFARGRIAGGFRGKLSVGPEAFFAPYVNIALTERRFVLQHIHSDDGRPSEILPHFYDLGEIAAITFTDIETFGGEPACRLVLRLTNDHHSRLRLSGQSNIESAQAIAEVFRSLTTRPHASVTTPTQRVCARCQHIMDQPSRFCPYCGTVQPTEQTAEAPRSGAMPDETAFAPSPDWEDTQDIELIAPVPVDDSVETPVAPTPPEFAPTPITVPANTVDEAGITEMIAPVTPAPPTGEAPPAAEVAPSVASLLETPAPPLPPAPPAVPNVPLPPFSVVAPMPPMPVAAPPPVAPVPPAETSITSGMEPGDVGFTASGSAFFHAPHAAEESESPAPAPAADTPQTADDTTEIADATQLETPAAAPPVDDTTEPLDAPPAPPAFGAPAATPAEPAHNEANPNTQGDFSR